MAGYIRFGAMIVTATVVMFCLTYLNSYSIDHVFISEERIYMSLLMGAVMAIVMLSFMMNMYKNKLANLLIIIGSVLLFTVALYLARSQDTIGDVAYMKGMIPHHSIAILTSERAEIKDPRVRQLADEIIAAQVQEIAEMKKLIDDLQQNPPPEDAPLLQSYRDLGEPAPK